jgi:hypothetical protein
MALDPEGKARRNGKKTSLFWKNNSPLLKFLLSRIPKLPPTSNGRRPSAGYSTNSKGNVHNTPSGVTGCPSVT